MYLDIWAGCFTISFAGSFHYFKPDFCWILFWESVTGVPRPFNQLLVHVGKVNTIYWWHSWIVPLFRLRWARWMMSHNYVVLLDLFAILSFLPVLAGYRPLLTALQSWPFVKLENCSSLRTRFKLTFGKLQNRLLQIKGSKGNGFDFKTTKFKFPFCISGFTVTFS